MPLCSVASNGRTGLLPGQFDASILCATFLCIVRGLRHALTLAVGGQTIGADLEPSDERVAHGGASPLGQLQVCGVTPDAVGVALDAQLPGRIALQRIGN